MDQFGGIKYRCSLCRRIKARSARGTHCDAARFAPYGFGSPSPLPHGPALTWIKDKCGHWRLLALPAVTCMPQAAIEFDGPIDLVGPVDELAAAICDLVQDGMNARTCKVLVR